MRVLFSENLGNGTSWFKWGAITYVWCRLNRNFPFHKSNFCWMRIKHVMTPYKSEPWGDITYVFQKKTIPQCYSFHLELPLFTPGKFTNAKLMWLLQFTAESPYFFNYGSCQFDNPELQIKMFLLFFFLSNISKCRVPDRVEIWDVFSYIHVVTPY